MSDQENSLPKVSHRTACPAYEIYNPKGKLTTHRKVSGEARLSFVVRLPMETAHETVMCDDPAIDAVLSTLPESIEVFVWGVDKKPAVVEFDIHEGDVDIEENLS